MSYELNRKIAGLTPYEPLSGTYQIRLDANESYMNLPEELRVKLGKLAQEIDYNRYPDPYCTELCKAFAAYYGIDAENVTAGNGSDELISVIVNAFSLKGENCFTFEQDFSMYRFYGELAKCTLETLPRKEDLSIDVDTAIDVLNRSGAGMLLFSNPCNPTSIGLSREQVRRLVRSVSCLVVLDEAYMDFWDQSLLGEAQEYDNLIVLKTCSKAFGMAGIRLGFAVANPTATRAIQAVKSPYNVNSITQEVGTAVLREQELLRARTAEIIANTKELYRMIGSLAQEFPQFGQVYPTVANFVYIKTEIGREIAEQLKQRSVAVRVFPNYLRISTGSAEENHIVVDYLRKILEEAA